MKKNVLFVCGFNTHPEDHNDEDIYSIFSIYFMYSDYNISFFRYRTSEDITDVRAALQKKITEKSYHVVIAHSMGGALVMKTMSECPNCLQDIKIILLMPFLTSNTLLDFVCSIPFIQHFKIPKNILIPNHKLHSMGNVFNDNFNLVSTKQMYDVHKNILLPKDTLLELINNHKDLLIIYANDEQVCPFDKDMLNGCIASDKLKCFDGQHVIFVDLKHYSPFFEYIHTLLLRENSNT